MNEEFKMVNLVITGIETVNAFDITTGDHLFTLDGLQSASIDNGYEKVDIVNQAIKVK